eukprot:SAG31_NODE_2004_length_6685_cov_2.189341_8_plen_91_part_00
MNVTAAVLNGNNSKLALDIDKIQSAIKESGGLRALASRVMEMEEGAAQGSDAAGGQAQVVLFRQFVHEVALSMLIVANHTAIHRKLLLGD